MRPVATIKLLNKILQPKHITTIVDVGANPFNGKPPYATLRRSGMCQIIGFEPQEEALLALQNSCRELETYLPYAVGDGSMETLYLTKNSGLVSILPIEPWIGTYLNQWWRQASVIRDEIPIQTHRLDEITEIDRIDFFKIDIQGGELKVFENGRRKLSNTAVIQTEVSILPYYKNSPTFGDIQSEMTQQGFIAHKFSEISRHHLQYNLRYARGHKIPPSQITVADVIFLRDPRNMEEIETEVIKHMAIIAHSVLKSYDLVLRCLGELVNRKCIGPDDIKHYVKILPRIDR